MYIAIAIVAVVLVVALLAYNAHLLVYVKSGQYDIDRRIDAVTE